MHRSYKRLVMSPLRESTTRGDAAAWWIAALGEFLPRMALGRRMRLVLLVWSFRRRRLIWISWVSGMG